jgi:hypothetical protein
MTGRYIGQMTGRIPPDPYNLRYNYNALNKL